MYAGCGRAGDFAGDPLATVASEFVAWTTAAREVARAFFATSGLPAGYSWITYMAGVIQAHAASSPAEFTVPVPETLPHLAAVAVASGVDADGLYDPLGGADVANISTLKTLFSYDINGRYRIRDDSLNRYELYRGVGASPDLDAAPYATFTALPYTTAAQTPGTTVNLIIRKRNAYNLISQNLDETQMIINADGSLGTYPAAPAEILAYPAPAGAARICGSYDYAAESAAIAADYWAIWITSDGSTPDPTAAPTTLIAMVKADGIAHLDVVSSAYGAGVPLKILVRARRATSAGGATGVDSQNSTVVTCARDTAGPSAPTLSRFYGRAARAL